MKTCITVLDTLLTVCMLLMALVAVSCVIAAFLRQDLWYAAAAGACLIAEVAFAVADTVICGKRMLAKEPRGLYEKSGCR